MVCKKRSEAISSRHCLQFSHTYIMKQTHSVITGSLLTLSLFQASNALRTLEGLERLQHLTKLHVRDNQIEKLDGFSENMANLQYINLRYKYEN